METGKVEIWDENELLEETGKGLEDGLLAEPSPP